MDDDQAMLKSLQWMNPKFGENGDLANRKFGKNGVSAIQKFGILGIQQIVIWRIFIAPKKMSFSIQPVSSCSLIL